MGSASRPTARRCTPAAASSRWSTLSPSTRGCCPTIGRSPSPRSRTSSSPPAWPWTRRDAPSSRPAAGAMPSPSSRSTTRASAARSPSTRTVIPTPVCPTPRAAGCSSACGARPPSPSSTRPRRKVVGTWPTETHPTEMALSPDGKTLFVACSNSTRVSVLDASRDGKGLETIRCALYPDAPSGNTPNSLTLTPDGQMLFVANADANNLAVFNVTAPGQSKPLGFIPTGWYPTSVRYNPADQRLYVANGKGLSSRANPQGPGPDAGQRAGVHLSVHRRSASGGSEHHRPARPGQAGRLHQAGLRLQSRCAPTRRRPATVPTTTPSRTRSATPARSSTASTSSRRTAPTIRSSAT